MSQPASNIRIDSDRLWDSLMEMAKIGPGVAGGNNRQTLTDEDSQGRDLFKQWCLKEGCTMGLDQMGNMFARREGGLIPMHFLFTSVRTWIHSRLGVSMMVS